MIRSIVNGGKSFKSRDSRQSSIREPKKDKRILKESILLNDIDSNNSFYFVHSYAYSNSNKDYVVGITNYDCDIVSVIEKENIFGVQFHPEKSQKYGHKLIHNFIVKNKC